MSIEIDVIIPTFNREETIARAIGSVLSQTYPHFKLWIIDDGSEDETEKIIQTYLKDPRVSYFKISNQGVSAARNFGVSKSEHDWIAFLDSDDEWLPHKLQAQVDFIQNHPDIPLIHGEEIWIRRGKRVNQKKIHQKFGGWIFERCLPLCLISPSATIIKRKVFHDLGGFDERFIVCEDYDLWLKVTSLYPVGFIESPIITKYGGHEDQLSAKYFGMDLWRIRALERILKIRELSLEQSQLVREEIQKKAKILLLGYQKHQNMDDYPEVEAILQRNS